MPVKGRPSSTGEDSEQFKKLTELIDDHPKSAELSVSFAKLFLVTLLLEVGSPDVALKKLLIVLKAFEDLKEMDQKMSANFPIFNQCSNSLQGWFGTLKDPDVIAVTVFSSVLGFLYF